MPLTDASQRGTDCTFTDGLVAQIVRTLIRTARQDSIYYSGLAIAFPFSCIELTHRRSDLSTASSISRLAETNLASQLRHRSYARSTTGRLDAHVPWESDLEEGR